MIEANRAPLLSVIVPVWGDPAMASLCLQSIRRSTFLSYEIVIADDGSPDEAGIQGVATEHGAKLVRLAENGGPAVARNRAAREAAGEILVFLDADVTVHPDTLRKFAAAVESQPALDALMGSYDFEPRVRGAVAVFRNLLHAWTHHRSSRQATTFWAGCGAVRRRVFERLSGFDESYRQPSIEDVEFGMRLHEAGGRLELDPSIQVTHYKEWTLISMLRTDAFSRAAPWTDLLSRHGLPSDLNFRWQDRASAASAVALPPLTFLAVRYGHAWTAAAWCLLATLALLYWPLGRFLGRQRGMAFAMASFPLYIAHLLSAALGFCLGLCRGELARDRWFAWATGGFALLIFGAVQFAGGAWRAGFDGYPDEPAHVMTGLMVRDYLAQWPPGNPVVWAEQYNLHYPKVAFGHWPPLFHLAEAAWWLFLPPGRWSAMLLVGLMSLAAVMGWYRLARRMVHPCVACAAGVLLVLTPVFQQAASMAMAEALSLFFGVLLLDVLARLANRGPTTALVWETSLWCVLGLLVKGTGASVLAAPVLVVLLAGQHRALPLRRVAFASLSVFLFGISWFAIQHGSLARMASWAGMSRWIPWTVWLTPYLAGWGVLALALGALVALLATKRYRDPVTCAAAAILISMAATSFFLRAMNEPRHWILALPAVLLLALASLRALWEIRWRGLRYVAVGIAVGAALAWFPWNRLRQTPRGYGEMLAQVPHPSRMVVSCAVDWREGGWIVAAGLREARPASVVARASKLFAKEGWNGQYYRLLATTPAAVEALLDRFGIDHVILDARIPNGAPSPHNELLSRALAASSALRQRAQPAGVPDGASLWDRVVPARTAREHLRVHPGDPTSPEIVER